MAKREAKQKVVIIGCGNLAWHLATHLASLKKFDLFVYNHQPNGLLNEFKKLYNCKVTASLENVRDDGDFYLVAVSDASIEKVETKIHLNKPGAVIMHTSGSASIEVLGERAHSSAVFYPLQTFSRRDSVRWKEIPVIIEADNEAVRQRVGTFASFFSETILYASYRERLNMHIAAVMCNNFTNALYHAALSFLNKRREEPVPPGLLFPLLKQTVKKLEHLTPAEAQTGPAKRGDEVTIEKHLLALRKEEDLRKVYKQLTKLIKKQNA